jgi:hypothetical protein
MLYLAVATDVLHAILMLSWIIGLPLLFWHHFPKLSLAYCIYCIAFIIVNQVSHYTLGCCIFSAIADWFYAHAGQTMSNEWFTVRASQFVFGPAPSHRGIKMATEAAIVVAAIGQIYFCVKGKINHVRRQKT